MILTLIITGLIWGVDFPDEVIDTDIPVRMKEFQQMDDKGVMELAKGSEWSWNEDNEMNMKY